SVVRSAFPVREGGEMGPNEQLIARDRPRAVVRLVNPSIEGLPVRLAQLALEQFARRVPRQHVREVHRRRTLEVRQRRSRAYAMISAGLDSLPGSRTTIAFTVSPHRASGTPMTATSATAGCSASVFSTSAGYTFSPPVIIMSFTRSVRNT